MTSTSVQINEGLPSQLYERKSDIILLLIIMMKLDYTRLLLHYTNIVYTAMIISAKFTAPPLESPPANIESPPVWYTSFPVELI